MVTIWEITLIVEPRPTLVVPPIHLVPPYLQLAETAVSLSLIRLLTVKAMDEAPDGSTHDLFVYSLKARRSISIISSHTRAL